jgi:hypothetical protein
MNYPAASFGVSEHSGEHFIPKASSPNGLIGVQSEFRLDSR